jgi:D-alanine-D-alanine ligase
MEVRMLVGLTYDLKAEHAPPADAPPDYAAEFDTAESVRAMAEAIENCGHRVRRIGNVHKLIEFLAQGGQVDVVFNMAEGLHGRSREAHVPAVLEAYQVPYTGSDPLTMALCLDKPTTKRLWQAEELPTADFCVVRDVAELADGLALPEFPLFVKPAYEGSSKGIDLGSIVESRPALARRVAWTLERYRQPALVEAFLPGREFTVGILGTGAEAQVLEVGEVLLVSQDKVHGADQKEHWMARLPDKLAHVEEPLRARLATLALGAYRAVGARDWGRVDLRLDRDGAPQLMEINPVAGLYPDRSSMPIVAALAGMSYEELLGAIVEQAIRRYGLD